MHKKTKSQLKTIAFIIGGLILFKILLGVVHLSPILFQLVFNKNIELKKTQDQRINVLLLGIGGGTHDGPDLTDTMIFASIDPSKNKIALISIPRDLWISDLSSKINAAYADGESKKKEGGLIESEAVVTKIVGQPINYGIRIDFKGFVKAVDLVGGLDIKVDTSFDDYQYPIEGREDDSCGLPNEELVALATASADLQFQKLQCRYTHIHFDKGFTHMDGASALQFVRSRHAEGNEGTDFARSSRQQKIISALKDKIISAQTIFDLPKVMSLYSVVKDSIDTDIKESEYDDFIRLANKMKKATIQNGALDIGDEKREGLLINPVISSDYNFEWVLIPKEGKDNYKKIQEYVTCMIKDGCKL